MNGLSCIFDRFPLSILGWITYAFWVVHAHDIWENRRTDYITINDILRFYHITQILLILTRSFVTISWVDNVNWPPLRISKLTFRASALRLSEWRNANARNVGFETLNGGQFALSTNFNNTKLPCYTLPAMQHHSFFRNVPLESMLQWVWIVRNRRMKKSRQAPPPRPLSSRSGSATDVTAAE